MAQVKVITQETFDEVVKENVDDFDLKAEEALKDAVEQFEKQVTLVHLKNTLF